MEQAILDSWPENGTLLTINQAIYIYVVGNEFIYNTEVLKSNYCDYNDTFILPRGDVIIAENNGAPVPLKKCTIWQVHYKIW